MRAYLTRGLGSAIAVLVPLLAGCGKQTAEQPDFPVPVKTAIASTEAVQERIRLVGTVLADEIVEIRPEIDGVVRSLGFSEGDEVREGQLLVQIDDSKLAAQLEEAEANFELAESDFERNERLRKSQTVSVQEFDQAQSRLSATRALLTLVKNRLSDTRIVAPFDGVTAARNVSPGQYVDPSTVITTLVKLKPVKVEFSVPERFLSLLAPGQTIRIRVAAFPEETFEGEVYFVSPMVNERTRAVPLKARVPNEDARLKPGMFANLDLVLSVRDSAIVIPEEAIAIVDAESAVYAVTDGVATLRMVQTGLRLPGKVEIVEGLEVGDEVITDGLQKIRPGSKVAPSGGTKPPDETL